MVSGFCQVQPATREDLAECLTSELRATVHEVVRLTPNIVEVVVKAPHGRSGV